MNGPSAAAHTADSLPETLDEAYQCIEHLRRAVESRGRIGQAVGILMCRYMISADAAFSAMSRVSQCHNLKLRAVADTVVATIAEPDAALPRELRNALEELLRVGEGNPVQVVGEGNPVQVVGEGSWLAASTRVENVHRGAVADRVAVPALPEASTDGGAGPERGGPA